MPATNSNPEREIDLAVDTAFEHLATALDEIARKHDLDSTTILNALEKAGPNFVGYWSDWVFESWEKAQPTR